MTSAHGHEPPPQFTTPPNPAETDPIQGPPYRPQVQLLGEVPSVIPDVPINVIFLLLFFAAGALSMLVLQLNLRKKKKFVFHGAIFGFCCTRVLATVMRIAWAAHPLNVGLAIAAMIFVYAGIILLFITNLFFAQRIVRAQHPQFGWKKSFSLALPALVAIMVAAVLCLIAAVFVEFYTLDPFSRHAAREIQRFGSTLFAICAFLPLPVVAASSLARCHPKIRMTKTTDKFGEGSMRAKVALVLLSAAILTLGAAFRAGTTFLPPHPLFLPGGNQPTPIPAPQPWYLTKAAFYTFDFTLEILVVALWLAARLDKRFHVPDGATGPQSYGSGFVFAGEAGNEKKKPMVGGGGVVRERDRERESEQPINFSRPSLGSRASWATATRIASGGIVGAAGQQQQQQKKLNRVSWGGSGTVPAPGLGEDGRQVVPYPTAKEGVTAADVGVAGVEKEMGWDPKTGKWAVRPISGAAASTAAVVAPSRPFSW